MAIAVAGLTVLVHDRLNLDRIGDPALLTSTSLGFVTKARATIESSAAGKIQTASSPLPRRLK